MNFVIEMLTRRVDYARFHRVYVSEELNRELAAAVNLQERRLLEYAVLPDGRERSRVYIAPRVDMPGAIAKLVANHAIGYEERSLYDPAARRADISVHTAVPQLLHVSAVTFFIEAPEGIRTRIELDLRVKLFGVGGMVERYMANETHKRYEIVERVLQDFVDSGRPAQSPQLTTTTS